MPAKQVRKNISHGPYAPGVIIHPVASGSEANTQIHAPRKSGWIRNPNIGWRTYAPASHTIIPSMILSVTMVHIRGVHQNSPETHPDARYAQRNPNTIPSGTATRNRLREWSADIEKKIQNNHKKSIDSLQKIKGKSLARKKRWREIKAYILSFAFSKIPI
jgi:hypothetical protein